jgi:uncharacterized damage-inducible protein DinB
MTEEKLPEPWLRGTLEETPPVLRAVLHALQSAKEDLERWCSRLTEAQLNARPGGIAPVAFHMRHISRSLDRLLSYAEGKQLSEAQLASLGTELDPEASRSELLNELAETLEQSAERIRRFKMSQLDEPRMVGRRGLPSTVGGLLVHIADHTQRHVGQAITTAKIVTGDLALASRATNS